MTEPQKNKDPQNTYIYLRQNLLQTEWEKKLQFHSLKTMSSNFNSHLSIFILDGLNKYNS